MNHELRPDGNINTTQTMTLDEFMFALNLVNQVASDDYDGTLGSVDRTLRLSKVLLNDPADFWNQWQLEMGDGMRARAIEFVQRPDFAGSLDDLKRFTEAR